VRLYRGDWAVHYDPQVIRAAVAAYKSAPASYAIDFGLTDTGKTLMVEVNEGYSIGCYGLFSTEYAQFLSARWAEITHTEDYGRY
jgi:ATP-grasp domain, R2K clade family 2